MVILKMPRKLISIVVALLGFLAVFNVSAAATTQYSHLYGKFLYQPAPAAPAITLPGGNFTLYLKSGLSIKFIEAVSILHGPYPLDVLSVKPQAGENLSTVIVKVPKNITPDDYFLLITTNKGTLVLPNGLKVFKKWPRVLRIAWVSDTHITSGSKIGYVCGPYFQTDIYKLERMCPNPIPLHSVVATDSAYTYWTMTGNSTLIINTGDVVDSSNDFGGYLTALNIMADSAAAGKLLVGIKGNHDNPPDVYAQVIGPTHFYVTIGKFIIIGLDTGGDRGYPTMDEIKWMEKVLNEHKGYTPIILYHHPYFFAPRWNYLGGIIKGLDPSTDWDQLKQYVGHYWGGDPEVAKRFLEDVVKYNIPLTLSGHIHHDMYWLYIDKDGHKHYFLTLTSTGAPDKETNPPTHPHYSPTWYGSNLVQIALNGSVNMPYVKVKIVDDKVKSNFMSVPVPQEFMVFKHFSNNGTTLEFLNELNHSVSGPIAIRIPKEAKVDPRVTNVTYKVLGVRQIGDRYYMLLNVTVPRGTSQLVVDKSKDTQKPTIQIAYFSYPTSNTSVLFFTASDNLGIRNLYAEVIGPNDKVITYGKVNKFPAEPGSGKSDNTFYTVELPPLPSGKYTVKVIAIDFYGNRAETSTTLTIGSVSSTLSTISTSSPSSSASTTSPTSTSKSGICGPATIVALSILPVILLRRK